MDPDAGSTEGDSSDPDGSDTDSGGTGDGEGHGGDSDALPNASWGPRVVLSSPGTSAYGADVNIDGLGNAHTIWFQDTALVGASHEFTSDTWTSQQVSVDNVCPQPLELQFAPDGRGALIWADGAYAPVMQMRTFAPEALGGTGWDAFTSLGIDVSNVWSASASMGDDGALSLAWIDNAQVSRLMAVTIDVSTGAMSPITTLYVAGDYAWPEALRVISDPAGARLVTWSESGQYGMERLACYLEQGVSPGCASPLVFSAGATATWGEAASVFLASGDAMVVYPSVDGPGLRYRARRFDAASESFGPEHDVTPVSTGSAHVPMLVADATGGAMLLWQQCLTTCGIWAKRWSEMSESWGPEMEVADDATVTYARAYAGADAEGNVLVVWSASDGFRMRVFERRFDAATGVWGDAAALDGGDSYGSENTVVAVNAQGQAWVVWTELTVDYLYTLVGRRL